MKKTLYSQAVPLRDYEIQKLIHRLIIKYNNDKGEYYPKLALSQTKEQIQNIHSSILLTKSSFLMKKSLNNSLILVNKSSHISKKQREKSIQTP